MIYVRITEGLGNQFYKYAFAYSLAKRYGRELIIDTAGYKFDPREFQLDRFCVTANVVRLAAPFRNDKFSKAAARAFRRLQIGTCYQYIEEDSSTYYRFIPIEKIPSCPVYIQGYWQNYRYFLECEDDIRKQFQLKEVPDYLAEICKRVSQEESIALHVRMGDYRPQDQIQIDYYFSALQYLTKRVNAKIYIFCEKNDLSGIREKFNTWSPIYVAEQYPLLNDIETFWLMKCCSHQIISNSTYSWWAAWLNNHEGKMVAAPLIDRLDREYYPKDWVVFPTNHIR